MKTILVKKKSGCFKLPSIEEGDRTTPSDDLIPTIQLSTPEGGENERMSRAVSPIHSLLKDIGTDAVDEYDNIVNANKRRPRKGSLPLPSLYVSPSSYAAEKKQVHVSDDSKLAISNSIAEEEECNNNSDDKCINKQPYTNISPDMSSKSKQRPQTHRRKDSISSIEMSLQRFKLDSDGRIQLFVVDMRRCIAQQRQLLINKSDDTGVEEIEKNILLYENLADIAKEFLDISDPQNLRLEGYIQELLKLLSDQGLGGVSGELQREKIINLLIIVSKFSRAKQILSSVGSSDWSAEEINDKNLIGSIKPTPSTTPQLEVPHSPLIIDKNPIVFQKSHFRSLSFSPKITEQQEAQKRLLETSDLKKKHTIFNLGKIDQSPTSSPPAASPVAKPGNYSPSSPSAPSSPSSTRHSPTPIKPPLLARRVFDQLNSNKQTPSHSGHHRESEDQRNPNGPERSSASVSSGSGSHPITNIATIIPTLPLSSLAKSQEIKKKEVKEENANRIILNNNDQKHLIPNAMISGNATSTFNEEDLFLSSDDESDLSSFDESGDEDDLPIKKRINEKQHQLISPNINAPEPVFLKDPRLIELKSSPSSERHLLTPPLNLKKLPLIRSKSFGPNKLELKSKTYKKLARSFSEIPHVKDLEIEKKPEEEMAICRICEDKIHSSLLQEHSKICALANQEDMKAMNVEDHLRAIAKILLTRGSDSPPEKRKLFTEIRDLALCAVENGTKECLKVINTLNDILKEFDNNDPNRDLISKIQLLITDKINALKRAEEVINSSPRIFRTNSPRILKSPRPCDLKFDGLSVTGRVRSDSDPTQFHAAYHSLMDNNNNNGTSNLNMNSNLIRPKGIPTISDFEFIKPITKGGFGKVFLAKKIRTGDIYAIKRLKKSDMIKKNQIDHVKVERNILAITSNPFVVKMYYSFQSKDYYYLVMEYLQGGDCFSLLQSLGALDEKMATMIIAETVLALEYLHSHGIIHRDLKPDNLLIDKDGHIKLTDFGLSKIGLLEKSTVGVPNTTYYSPSMSAQKSNILSQVGPKKPGKLLPLSVTKSLLSGSSSSPSIPSLNLQNYKSALPHHDHTNKENVVNQSNIAETFAPPIANPHYKYTDKPGSPALPALSLMKEDGKPAQPQSPTLSKINAADKDSIPSHLYNVLGPINPQQSQQIGPTNSRKLSCVGTPDYLAPEILLGIDHGASADWFSLGVILYEFLCGVPPFSAPTVQETFQNILKRNISWPDDISPEAKDIIDKLLALDQKSRLGYNGAKEVKSHPFFKGINWSTIRTQEPYFKPKLDSLHDTSYFEPRKEFHDLRISQDSSLTTSPFDQNSCFNLTSGNMNDSTGISSSTSSNKPFDDFLYVNFQSLLELNQSYLNETNISSKYKRRSSI